MSRLRTFTLMAATTALAVSALAAPAAAAHPKGTFAVVNGIPGAKVDICINGKEVKSGMGYGGKVFRTMSAGPKTIKVFRKDPRKCKGVKLAQGGFELASDVDVTVVATKKAPKIIVFDNPGVGAIPPTGPDAIAAFFAWRHAADLGIVDFGYNVFNDISVVPSGHASWQKGDELRTDAGDTATWRLFATKPHQTKRIARSKWVSPRLSRRYEWYLVGTTAKNAKFVTFSRAISANVAPCGASCSP